MSAWMPAPPLQSEPARERIMKYCFIAFSIWKSALHSLMNLFLNLINAIFSLMNLVKRSIPAFPYRFSAHGFQVALHFPCLARIAHVKLWQGIRITGIPSGVCMTFGTHGGNTQRSHVIAHFGILSGGVRHVHIMIKDTHGKGNLRQFSVGHLHTRLKSAVLRFTHTGKVHTELGTPIGLLEITQVICHHSYLCAPVFQSDECAHTYLVYSCHTHTVIAVQTPFIVGLRTSGMILLIVGLMISLLKADNAIESVMSQHRIVFCGKRHHFYLQVIEIGLCQIQCPGNIVHSRHSRILSGKD